MHQKKGLNVNEIRENSDAIVLENVTKEYPGVKALKGISFRVKQGSVHAFLGPNGAGKSTTMKIITGLIPASSGRVDVSERIGFLPENPPLYTNMKVRDYLEFVGKIQTLSKSHQADVAGILKKCSLEHVADRMIGNLSKGYKQRVGIAQALVFSPSIIILDEPTVGLDPKAIAEIRELILELKKDHTILLSTHQLHEASLICSDVTIINDGIILKSGPLEEVQRSFETTQLVRAKVRHWDENVKKKFLESFALSEIEVREKDQVFDLKFVSSEKRDLREDLVQKLVTEQCRLLEFTQERVDLEEIFKMVTGGQE